MDAVVSQLMEKGKDINLTEVIRLEFANVGKSLTNDNITKILYKKTHPELTCEHLIGKYDIEAKVRIGDESKHYPLFFPKRKQEKGSVGESFFMLNFDVLVKEKFTIKEYLFLGKEEYYLRGSLPDFLGLTARIPLSEPLYKNTAPGQIHHYKLPIYDFENPKRDSIGGIYFN